ncbi:MAG: M20/M25/M40 family metallo-hydrolase [Anaerolineae bacterium]|nr:M20/M25/M40 family metallo-hydrolase [Anaerolineae bacterium]
MDTLLIVLAGVLVVFGLLILLLILRTRAFSGKTPAIPQVELPSIDAERAAEHLANTIRCETLSNPDVAKINLAAFDQLHQTLETDFPLLHRHLRKEVYEGHNLIYHWEGSEPEMAPILFMAHQDVVPADPSSLDRWTHPPFSGAIVDGVVWGRGTLDCKSQLVGVMEAVENLLQQDYQPERTIILAFGQDEEIGGLRGQKLMAEHFQQQGIQFAAVIDEGGAILTGQIPGVAAPVALVGNCEKGYLSLQIKAVGSGGHSSMPPKVTQIGRLARGIVRLETNPVPAEMERIIPMFKGMGDKAPFLYRMAFANLWLFKGFLMKKIEASPKMSAIIRTTTAPTIINGGVKDNVLPSEVSAVVNFRLASGDSIASVIEYVKFLLRDLDLEVSVAGDHPGEASPVSSMKSPAFHRLDTCIKQVFGDVAVAPFIMLGATDARYYAGLSENVYRFAPLHMQEGQMDSVHNFNEHITVEQFAGMVQFFIHLIQSWSRASWVD